MGVCNFFELLNHNARAFEKRLCNCAVFRGILFSYGQVYFALVPYIPDCPSVRVRLSFNLTIASRLQV